MSKRFANLVVIVGLRTLNSEKRRLGGPGYLLTRAGIRGGAQTRSCASHKTIAGAMVAVGSAIGDNPVEV